MICTDCTSYLWMLAWRWSNKTETCCHNKILIFIHCCCVLTVILKHSVLVLRGSGYGIIQCVAKNFAQRIEKHHKILPKTWNRNVLKLSNMIQKTKYEGKQITFVLQKNPKLLHTQSKLSRNSNHVGQVQVSLQINTCTLFTQKCFVKWCFTAVCSASSGHYLQQVWKYPWLYETNHQWNVKDKVTIITHH